MFLPALHVSKQVGLNASRRADRARLKEGTDAHASISVGPCDIGYDTACLNLVPFVPLSFHKEVPTGEVFML
jgi:hypothetical protein